MEVERLSIGDILMLSQVAWRIGRAFRHGAKNGPADLVAVERGADGLSEALKLLAETLHTDGSILMAADDDTKCAVQAILQSAKTILDDLESFVDRYQIIKKKETAGGFTVERTWSDVVLANFNTLTWTTGGGNVAELRDVLRVHASAINSMMQALQSHSLTRLESTVIPMAKNISKRNSDDTNRYGHKVQNLGRITDNVMSNSSGANNKGISSNEAIARENLAELSLRGTRSALPPSTLRSTRPPGPLTSRSPSSTSSKSTERRLSFLAGPSETTPAAPVGNLLTDSTSRQLRDNTFGSSPSSSTGHQPPQPVDWAVEDSVRFDSPIESRNGVSKVVDSPIHRSPDHLSTRPDTARRESTTLPRTNTDFIFDREQGTFYTQPTSTPHASPKDSSKPSSRRQSKGILPPPAIPTNPLQMTSSPATPGTLLGKALDKEGLQSLQNSPSWPNSRYPGTPEMAKPKTLSMFGPGPESSQFEKDLFRNSAILCDVRGKLIEIAHFLPDEPDARYNTEMRPVCQDARICVIRKRENHEHGGFRIATSVWALSDDGQVRMQQRLSDVHETVPYCSYFQAEKVSLQPTGGDIVVRIHSSQWGAAPAEEKSTTWINYIFHGESDAIAFQSAVYGRMLIGAYHTTKTTVIHEGIKGAFAFEEQFANIEMLRLWEDDGVSTPGATGGVLALMHISSSFGEGWARWWINNNQQHLRVKQDSNPRVAKVKGLNITVVRPGMSGRVERARTLALQSEALDQIDTTSIRGVAKDPGKRLPVKRVNGVRIEFNTEVERNAFVAMCKRCQTTMLPLPEL